MTSEAIELTSGQKLMSNPDVILREEEEDGALLYCREQVAWEAGVEEIVLRGGYSRRTGLRSVLRVNSIVATTSVDKGADDWAGTPALTNPRLFRRDGLHGRLGAVTRGTDG